MKLRHARSWFLSALLVSTSSLSAQVAINEIFYHGPDDLDSLQWVELYNTTSQPVDLSGWRLAKGVAFTFEPGSTLGAQGYLVLCKDRKVFDEFYTVPVAGEFKKSIKSGGDRLELRDRDGRLIDGVTFDDRAPWPSAADGETASLERICPTEGGDDPANWQGSPLSEDGNRPGGTPGQRNAAFRATLPPSLSHIAFPTNTVAPQQAITVQAKVQSKSPIKEVALLYRVVRSGMPGEEKSVPMVAVGTDASYKAEIPGQDAGQIVRFRIRAVDQNNAERLHPAPTEPHPAFSCLVFTNATPGKLPLAYLIHPDPDAAEKALRQARGGGGGENAMGRFMMQMQFRGALDLPSLWASLTLSNATPAGV
ncbi:MAG: lamin tail domain-containing protein, partial [Verrucomicrobiales bacterium]|nr:lamin tail domain-containing protein [Verrucomicrobiales bacterium]